MFHSTSRSGVCLSGNREQIFSNMKMCFHVFMFPTCWESSPHFASPSLSSFPPSPPSLPPSLCFSTLSHLIQKPFCVTLGSFTVLTGKPASQRPGSVMVSLTAPMTQMKQIKLVSQTMLCCLLTNEMLSFQIWTPIRTACSDLVWKSGFWRLGSDDLKDHC